MNRCTLGTSLYFSFVHRCGMAKKTKTYDFIDLFAGIGGFHVAFNKTKRARCVFSSEWNPAARETYRHFFNDEAHLFTAGEKFFNKDITSIKGRAIKTDIPDFNILCGGFPCQPSWKMCVVF